VHKIKREKTDSNTEYREKCESLHCPRKTTWVYKVNILNIMRCGHCQRILRGKSLMEKQAARVVYHKKDQI